MTNIFVLYLFLKVGGGSRVQVLQARASELLANFSAMTDDASRLIVRMAGIIPPECELQDEVASARAHLEKAQSLLRVVDFAHEGVVSTQDLNAVSFLHGVVQDVGLLVHLLVVAAMGAIVDPEGMPMVQAEQDTIWQAIDDIGRKRL